MSDTKKAREAQITYAQLAIFMVVQIILIIRLLLPAFLGDSIDPVWFLTSLIISIVAYFLIMILRGKFEIKPELIPILAKVIEDVGVSLLDRSMTSEQKIKSAVKSIILLVQELEILYEEDKKIIDAQFRDFIKKKAEEIIYGIVQPEIKEELISKPYFQKAVPGATITDKEVVLNGLRQLDAGISEKQPEIKAKIAELEKEIKPVDGEETTTDGKY